MLTTKQGDGGYTRLADGSTVTKASPYCEVCGTIDELSSALGVAKAEGNANMFVRKEIESIQYDLQVVCSFLSCVNPTHAFNADFIKKLDAKRDSLENRVSLPTGFILPGDTKLSAFLDVARTISRRVEREAVKVFNKKKDVDKTPLIWLNRLSDYIYLLARYAEGRVR